MSDSVASLPLNVCSTVCEYEMACVQDIDFQNLNLQSVCHSQVFTHFYQNEWDVCVCWGQL